MGVTPQLMRVASARPATWLGKSILVWVLAIPQPNKNIQVLIKNAIAESEKKIEDHVTNEQKEHT